MTLKKEMHDCAIVILATILDSKEGTREYVSIDTGRISKFPVPGYTTCMHIS